MRFGKFIIGCIPALGLIIAFLALAFTAGMFYMQVHTFKGQIDSKKHEKDVKELIEKIQEIPEVGSDFNPNFGVIIEDFDFIMNLETINSTITEYDPGHYLLSSTPYGKATLQLIESKLNEIISINESSIVIKIEARGGADGLRVRDGSYYDGQLGEYLKINYFRYHRPNEKLTATFISGKTAMENEYFALLRAYDVVNQLKIKYGIHPDNIKIFVQEFNYVGGEYRRCDMSITVEKAFLNSYNELNRVSKFIINNF